MPTQVGGANGPLAIVPARPLAPTEAPCRWAALLQQNLEVDPLACPSCHGAMRIVAFITQTSVIDQILTHRRTRASGGDRRRGRPSHRRDGWVRAGVALPTVTAVNTVPRGARMRSGHAAARHTNAISRYPGGLSPFGVNRRTVYLRLAYQ